MLYHLLLREFVHDYAIAAMLQQRCAYKTGQIGGVDPDHTGESAALFHLYHSDDQEVDEKDPRSPLSDC